MCFCKYDLEKPFSDKNKRNNYGNNNNNNNNILHQIFRCLQYPHLKKYKITMMYTEVKIT